jgi:hypothetical protein
MTTTTKITIRVVLAVLRATHQHWYCGFGSSIKDPGGGTFPAACCYPDVSLSFSLALLFRRRHFEICRNSCAIEGSCL